MKATENPIIFTQVIHKIEDIDAANDAAANGLFLKSVRISRYEIKENGEIGTCIEQMIRKYLNGKLHRISRLSEDGSLISSQQKVDFSKLSINYQTYSEQSSKWCKVEFSTHESDLPAGILTDGYTKLIFKLDQGRRIIALSQVSGDKTVVPQVYFRFYEYFDDQGNWIQMRESIDQDIFVVKREIEYY